MKRLAFVSGLVMLLVLAACNGQVPTTQEALPTDSGPATPTLVDEAYPAPATTPPEGQPPTAEGEAPAEDGVPGTPGADLMGVTWEWVSVIDPMGQTTASDPTRYTLVFNADGTVSVKADCNNGSGTYITDGTNLSLTMGPITAAACPEDTQDQLFLNSLTSAAAYEVVDGELFITLQAESGTMIFRPGTAAPPAGEVPAPAVDPALIGVTWEWTSTSTGEGTLEVLDPTRYTITFNDDGTANVKADCNNVLASVTAADSAISITLGPSTLVACPPDSQVNDFLAVLPTVVIYSFIDGNLVLDAPADSGSMVFRAAGGAEAPAGDSLTGVTWEWVETVTPVETITAADPTLYQITFNEDGTAGIKADCNVGSAEYTTGEGGEISITLGVSTLAFCENSQDQVFRNGLAAAAIYFFQEGDLYIDQIADAGTMRFRAAGASDEVKGDAGATLSPPVLTGIQWQLNLMDLASGTVTTNSPAEYAITFNEDGTAALQNGCNLVQAAYAVGAGNTLTITPGASTLVQCGPGSLDLLVLNSLTNAYGYRLEEGGLLIDLQDQGGTLVYSPAP